MPKMTYFDKAINEYIEESNSETPHFDLICYICENCKRCPIVKGCRGRSAKEVEKLLMEKCDNA